MSGSLGWPTAQSTGTTGTLGWPTAAPPQAATTNALAPAPQNALTSPQPQQLTPQQLAQLFAMIQGLPQGVTPQILQQMMQTNPTMTPGAASGALQQYGQMVGGAASTPQQLQAAMQWYAQQPPAPQGTRLQTQGPQNQQ